MKRCMYTGTGFIKTVVFCVCLLCFLGCSTVQVYAVEPADLKTFNQIIISSPDERLMAVFSPVLSLSELEKVPLLYYTPSIYTKISQNRILQTGAENILVITPARSTRIPDNLKHLAFTIQFVNHNIFQSSMDIARIFFPGTGKAICASADDPEGIALGATLAAHSGVPFFPVTADRYSIEQWQNYIQQEEVGTVMVILPEEGITSALERTVNGIAVKETLSREECSQKISRLLQEKHRVRNVIVSRGTDNSDMPFTPVYAAPYLSFVRKSPLILCRNDDVEVVERETELFLARNGIVPSTVTILADYETIGVKTVELGEEYEIEVEPFASTPRGTPLSYGVGRIPFYKLEETMGVLLNGFARERNFSQKPPKVMMIANPQTSYGVLPLCETVARSSGMEFKNLGIDITEFYNKNPYEPEMFTCAPDADWIIFHGHITEFYLFDDREIDEGFFDGEWDEYLLDDGSVFVPPVEGSLGYSSAPPIDTEAGGHLEDVPEPEVVPENNRSDPAEDQDGNQEVVQIIRDDHDAEDEGEVVFQNDGVAEQVDVQKITPINELKRNSFIILQSCHSLEDDNAEWIFSRGGSAILGSTTNIHSASGSTFIKAYCDSILSRGTTAGEALRDARNYFGCLDLLREKRGHKELAKMQRVGMSFRLWGDPELAVLPQQHQKPVIPHLSGEFAGRKTFRIQLPSNKFSPVFTDRYSLEFFSMSEGAGIVKRMEGQGKRMIMPLYYFVQPIPEWFKEESPANIFRLKDKTERSVFMIDQSQDRLYILYFPGKEKKSGTYILTFTD